MPFFVAQSHWNNVFFVWILIRSFRILVEKGFPDAAASFLNKHRQLHEAEHGEQISQLAGIYSVKLIFFFLK